jgi:2,3-dimethylmalate lyase
MPAKSFRDLLADEGPLVLPGVHDALSARLARQAGFAAYFIGGFPAVGARYGVPDIGLKSLGEISAAVRDIVAASDLPVLVDADDGYGDVKNVVHTLHTYERMGVAAATWRERPSCPRSRWKRRCAPPRASA